MISFACPACSKAYTVTADKAGLRAKCRLCGGPLVVPPAPPAPPPAQGDADPALASAGTGDWAKAPTDAEFILPPVADADLPTSETDDSAVATATEFVVRLEFAGDPGTSAGESGDIRERTHQFLADVLYAYRRHLEPAGAKLKTIRVGGVEREV